MKKTTKKELVAALAMLLVAAVMMTSASFAWFTITQTPEVEKVGVQMNGLQNLEIARATRASVEGGKYFLESPTEAALYQAQDEHADVFWGNSILSFAKLAEIKVPSVLSRGAVQATMGSISGDTVNGVYNVYTTTVNGAAEKRVVVKEDGHYYNAEGGSIGSDVTDDIKDEDKNNLKPVPASGSEEMSALATVSYGIKGTVGDGRINDIKYVQNLTLGAVNSSSEACYLNMDGTATVAAVKYMWLRTNTSGAINVTVSGIHMTRSATTLDYEKVSNAAVLTKGVYYKTETGTDYANRNIGLYFRVLTGDAAKQTSVQAIDLAEGTTVAAVGFTSEDATDSEVYGTASLGEFNANEAVLVEMVIYYKGSDMTAEDALYNSYILFDKIEFWNENITNTGN